MVAETRRDRSRIALGSLLLLGSYVGCFPDFDALSSGPDDEGGEAGVGGATGGSTGSGGTTGDAGIGGEGGESAGNGGTGNGGNATGGSSKGGSNTGGSGKGGNNTGGSSSGGKGGSSGGKGGGAGAGGTTAGQAGSSGAVATGGAGGVGAEAGAGAGGAAAGTGGAGGQTCTEPTGVTAGGVEKLMVPLTAVGQGQRFNVHNRASPSMPYDLSGATVTIRAYAPCAVGGNLSIFFRSTSVTESPTKKVALATLVAGFVDIEVPVPEATGTFDPTLVDVIRIEVEADPAYGYDFQSPATVIYIDSVVSSNGAVTYPFDTLPANLDFGSSGARPLDGTTYVWLSQYP